MHTLPQQAPDVWEIREGVASRFQPARLYLASGPIPDERTGLARLNPAGWLDFIPDAALSDDTVCQCFPPSRVQRVDWLRPKEEAR
jgi:hypothetical protein